MYRQLQWIGKVPLHALRPLPRALAVEEAEVATAEAVDLEVVDIPGQLAGAGAGVVAGAGAGALLWERRNPMVRLLTKIDRHD